MKKIMGIILTITMLTALVGCAESQVQENMTAEISPSASQSSPESALEKPEAMPEEKLDNKIEDDKFDKNNQPSTRDENSIETENKAQLTDSKDVAIDHNNFDAIFSKYVAPIASSGLLFKTWNTPEDLAANKLIDFYGYNKVYLDEKYIGADANTPVGIQSSVVESYIRQHFIVSTEHLQTSDYYEASEQSYILIVGGRGGGAMPIITEVQQDEKNLSISLEPNPEDGGSSYRVTLNVSIDAESWKYESCSYNIL